ncbi:hypothetical protein F5148DRAFT_1146651 [Russula earlei]|uniref:Uncharacterized protein n=1 Tax=Russula earlei TaxID=71964 RepID=A0ACC0UJG1_9AGAM|nr:hypothetical protein F5148DRAFT_1146651 [Russula earlei]
MGPGGAEGAETVVAERRAEAVDSGEAKVAWAEVVAVAAGDASDTVDGAELVPRLGWQGWCWCYMDDSADTVAGDGAEVKMVGEAMMEDAGATSHESRRITLHMPCAMLFSMCHMVKGVLRGSVRQLGPAGLDVFKPYRCQSLYWEYF